MITVLPVKDMSRLEALYREAGLLLEADSGGVEARDGTVSLGYCLYRLDAAAMEVQALSPASDLPMADGVLRSALHVAVTRGVLTARYAAGAPVECIRRLGFIKNDENRELDIGKLFSSCQNCGGAG